MRLTKRFIEVSREQGNIEAFKRASRRIGSWLEVGIRMILAYLNRFSSLSDRRLIRQLEPQWDNIDEFIAHLRAKDSFAFPFSNAEKDDFLMALEEQFPLARTQTIQDAERILRHEFHMLGQDFVFPGRIDWHFDPAAGEAWVRQYIGVMERWFWGESRDPLPIWELNRHQYFTTLGKAYWLTQDERYADEFCDQIMSWVRQNPYQFGINWIAVLEIGVRIISWSLAFYFFRESNTFIEKASKVLVESLYQQTHFLRNHLTLDWPVQNNWMICQAAALVTVGALFPEFQESQDWVYTGLQILEREAALQTFPDGVNKEQAVGYHRFVLDLLLLIVILGRRGAVPRSQALEQLVEKMLEYALYSVNPEGRLSQLGDTDEGWGFRFSGRVDYWDVRPWLAVGAVLFHRSEFKFASKGFGEESFWLLGEAGLSEFREMEERIPLHTSFSFGDGGHYILRDNWTSKSDFLIIKSGEFGLGGEGFCAHSHCDLLSFVLWIEGRPLIVDSGTCTYHGPWRSTFRLTSAHNTLLIDGRDQAVPITDFFWTQIPKATCEYYNEKTVRAVLPNIHGVTVRREIHHPIPGSWHISDTVSGQGERDIGWFFHFAPDLSLHWSDMAERFVVEERGGPYVIVVPPPGVEVHIESGWYSSRYGHKEPNPLLVATWRGRIPFDGVRFGWELRYVEKVGK